MRIGNQRLSPTTLALEIVPTARRRLTALAVLTSVKGDGVSMVLAIGIRATHDFFLLADATGREHPLNLCSDARVGFEGGGLPLQDLQRMEGVVPLLVLWTL